MAFAVRFHDPQPIWVKTIHTFLWVNAGIVQIVHAKPSMCFFYGFTETQKVLILAERPNLSFFDFNSHFEKNQYWQKLVDFGFRATSYYFGRHYEKEANKQKIQTKIFFIELHYTVVFVMYHSRSHKFTYRPDLISCWIVWS